MSGLLPDCTVGGITETIAVFPTLGQALVNLAA
jgi:hypothetical protein